MTTSDKLREISEKYFPTEEKLSNNSLYNQLQQSSQDKLLSDLTALLEQHKEMMLREELIAYDKFLSSTCWGVSHILKHEEAVDEYLKNVKKS